jgi:membrane protein DedA with SNARE-associated domain
MIQTITALLVQYKYALVIPLTIVEGPLIMMMSGLLLKLGYFNFWPLYISLMVGDLIGDIFWYSLGRFWGHRFVRRFGKYFSITESHIATLERVFHKYHNAILVISKITMGLGFAVVTLFTAGLVKIPFKKYLWLNFLGQFIWTGILVSIGFMFGNLYLSINDSLGRLSVIALLIIVFVAFLGLGKYVRKTILKTDMA